ncbi:MAG: hypothetical protein RMM10_11150 [Anaerolineae bacterium]|uniref:hypothetical protein n=1 Tax=Thermoflexus sp. TaxID=1969742 RepID=UPI002600B23F|nr:hypothetical protein [Thermoflexus sp.]MCS7352056.1 baseplate J/gp47 family protein [Thermoflexus sp.]MDW8181515.1 hypothetical protein [Anaerolineae bacterium]
MTKNEGHHPASGAENPPEILTVWPDDDWASLRFRIAISPASRVILEVPAEHPTLSPVLLRRLQHLAEGIGKGIALVTPSVEGRRIARELGIPAFSHREAAWRSSWPILEEGEEPVASLGMTSAIRAWAEARRRPLPRWAYGLSLLIGGLGLLSVLFLIVFLFPSAEVTLHPQGQPVAVKESLMADPRLVARDLTRGAIPAYPVAVVVEGRAETRATGRQEQPRGYAEGQVVLVNQTARPVEVPAGTIVRAASGNLAVRFVISPSVTVPAGFGGTAIAQVRALEPGPAGNVGPNQINLVEGPLAFSLRVSNPEPLTGGKLETVPVVAAADRERVREALIAQLRQQGYAQLQAGLDPQDCVLPQTLRVEPLLEGYDRLVGEPAEALRAEMRARVVGYKVLRSDIGAMALIALARQVPPGYELAAEGFAFTGCEDLEATVETDEEGQPRIRLNVQAQGKAIPRLSIARIRKELRGQSVGGALQRLQALPLAQPPEIRVSPAGWPWLPLLESRIRVRIR